MFRLTIFLTVMMGLWTNVAIGQSEPPSEIDNDNDAIEKFESSGVSVDFFETRMADVIKHLDAETDLSFKLDESAEDNNLDEESLITLSMTETRLSTVIKFMLDEFNCTWSFRDGVVVILSRDAAFDHLALRTYDCADLLARIKPRRIYRRPFGDSSGGSAVPVVGGVFSFPEVQQEDGGFGGGKPAASQSADAKPDEKETKPEEDAGVARLVSAEEQLLDLVTGMVDPNSWEEHGGNGRCQLVNNVLVVRQMTENLHEVHLLLERLRDSGLKE